MVQVTKFDIEMFAKRASQAYVEHGTDLNDSIFKIAREYELNREQIRRVVESTNTMVNGDLVRHAKTAGDDPRIAFPMADSHKILTRMIADSPAGVVAKDQQAEKLASMFRVEEARPDFTKVADTTPPAPTMSTMSGPELAAAYVRGQDLAKFAFTQGQIVDAISDLVRLQDQGTLNMAQCDNFEQEALDTFTREVESQLHAGMTPSTLKSIVDGSQALDWHKKTACSIIDKIATDFGVRPGANQVDAGSIVDSQHPLVEAVEALVTIDAARGAVLTVAEKVAEARERAAADLERGRREKLAFIPATALPKMKGMLGTAGRVFGGALNAMEVKERAAKATTRLKAMQRTPMVGAMKTASVLDGLQPTIGAVGRAAAIAAGASLLLVGAEKGLGAATGAVGSVFEKRKRNKLFEQLLVKEPSLKSNPRAREYFDLVMTYAPSLGDHPTAIGDFLKRQLQYPATSVEFLQSLAQLQKTIRDSRSTGTNPVAESVRGVLGKAQGEWVKS